MTVHSFIQSPLDSWETFVTALRLTQADIDLHGLRLLSPSAVALALGWESEGHESGVQIPYFDMDSQPLGISRIRLLNHVGRGKYQQPRETGCLIYLNKFVQWRAALRTEYKIILVEGEKKALVLQKFLGTSEYLVIALGGVNSYWVDGSLHPTLKTLCQNRLVYILFDFDGGDMPWKAPVSRAMGDLMSLLHGKAGSTCLSLNLYDVVSDKTRKVGIDDYLLAGPWPETPEARVKLPVWQRLIATADIPPTECSPLALNAEIAFMRDSASFYHLETRATYSHEQAKLLYMPRKITKIDEQGRVKVVPMFDVWLHHPKRLELRGFTFDGADPSQITDSGHANLWRGWRYVPRAGDVAPWLRHIKSRFDATDAEIAWFHDRTAYLIQHIGERIPSYYLLQSTHHGTGKSSLFEVIGGLMHPENVVRASMHDLRSSHFTRDQGAILLIINEASEDLTKSNKEYIKNRADSKTLYMNPKGVRGYDVPNVATLCFTSNKDIPGLLDADDRRAAVFRFKNSDAKSDVGTLFTWLRGGGYDNLLHWYLTRDLSQFDPFGRPPLSGAKRDIIEASRDALDEFFISLSEDDAAGELFSSAQFSQMLELRGARYGQGAIALRAENFFTRLKDPQGDRGRFYINKRQYTLFCRKNSPWETADRLDVFRHMEGGNIKKDKF